MSDRMNNGNEPEGEESPIPGIALVVGAVAAFLLLKSAKPKSMEEQLAAMSDDELRALWDNTLWGDTGSAEHRLFHLAEAETARRCRERQRRIQGPRPTSSGVGNQGTGGPPPAATPGTPRQEGRPCSVCDGAGHRGACPRCGGRGEVDHGRDLSLFADVSNPHYPYIRERAREDPCRLCHGSGRHQCEYCRGTGRTA